MRNLLFIKFIFFFVLSSVYLLPQASKAGYYDYGRAMPSFFDSTEIESDNLSGFKKWRGMLHRYFDELRSYNGDRSCNYNYYDLCYLPKWSDKFSGTVSMNLFDKLQVVNSHINKKFYIIDPINWGVSDYWETPKEFASRGGDCEDYAIAKYISLRSLGVPNDAMRVVILEDKNLDAIHAVLVVQAGSSNWVLDNQISQVVDASQIHHYRPIYSINETNWWRHR